MTIRALEPDQDAEDVVALLRTVRPTAVVSETSFVHQLRAVPERARLKSLVAVDGDRVVADAFAFHNFFSEGSSTAVLGLTVHPSHRRRGIATALYERLVDHARSFGATELHSTFFENDAGVAFARRRGFEEARAEAESLLDPRTVAERPDATVDLRPVADVDPRLVYEVDVKATLDMPSTEPYDHMPYDEWEQHVLANPLFTSDGSFAAMVDGVAAAVSLLVVDDSSKRAANMFTGTLPPYRGCGLARAVKLASIHWAARQGITSMVTTNDETNDAMLAVNRRLGYVPGGRRVEYVRVGMPASPAPPAPVT